MMEFFQIVIDTNVMIAALRSKRGASYKLLTLMGQSEPFQINVSVPLILEYEAVFQTPRARNRTDASGY